MKRLSLTTLALAAALFSACGAPAGSNAPAANASNAENANSAKPATEPPTKDALMTLERFGWEAWKNRDPKWTEENYSEKGFNVGPTGRIEKAGMIKAFTTQKCEIKSLSLSDDQMRMAGPDVAILTFKADQDAVCDGTKNAPSVRSASIYIREGDKWKAVFYAEAPIIDPKAASAKPTANPEAPKPDAATPPAPDAVTEALLPAEKAVWEAWKDQDGKRIEELITPEISFINIFGTYFPTRADAIKDWTSHGCVVKTVSVTHAKATTLSPTAAILTFKGGADGTCFGQKIGPIWGTSVYGKDGDKWKWTFGINIPAQ
ncbi:hypothetical protein BH10ACI2_BH10ACI2_11490 [soil metagenome]